MMRGDQKLKTTGLFDVEILVGQRDRQFLGGGVEAEDTVLP